MPRVIHAISRLVLLVPLYATAQQQPSLSGFVTDPSSPETFAMNGIRVTCTSTTENVMVNASENVDEDEEGKNHDASESVEVKRVPSALSRRERDGVRSI